MHETLGRLENLVQGCIRILDHMKVGGPDDQKLEQAKRALEQEYDHVVGLSGRLDDIEQCRRTVATMQRRIHEIAEMLEPVRSQLAQEYRQRTGNATDAFERRPLDEQKEDTATYHSKIDLRSAEKLEDNMDKIVRELLELSFRLEQSERRDARNAAQHGGGFKAAGAAKFDEDRSAGFDRAPVPEFDRDPAPPSLSP